MKDLIRKFINYEVISYIIVGVLTTAVDYIVFVIVNEGLKRSGGSLVDPALTATVVSWIAAVLFAYIANKLVVFKNYDLRPLYLIKEAGSFVGARLISGIIVLIFMWVSVSLLEWNEYVAKILSSVFNLVFNYVASKIFIFRK